MKQALNAVIAVLFVGGIGIGLWVVGSPKSMRLAEMDRLTAGMMETTASRLGFCKEDLSDLGETPDLQLVLDRCDVHVDPHPRLPRHALTLRQDLSTGFLTLCAAFDDARRAQRHHARVDAKTGCIEIERG